jgi:subtilisin family serine protease
LTSRTPLAVALLAAALVAAPSTAVAEEIEGQYIVVLKADSSGAEAVRAKTKARTRGNRIQHEYGSAIKGFSAKLDKRALAQVENDPAVAYVEPDQVMTVVQTQQPNATWGLDRIDQRNLPLNTTYTYTRTGAGVKAYIIDTGLRFSHAQFAGRAQSGLDAVDGGNADDCNGHGTHVGGTVGGSTHGVAKGVTLVGVRVLGCNGSGSTSGVIAGINWVTSDHPAGMPAVANMSLGGGASTALDNAVNASIADGVTYVVAAGNSNTNACNSSPARVANAVTVAATTSSDARSSFSNFGTCVDVFAPGSSITSAWHTSDTATNTISGTSMASPHVAGVAALLLQGSSGNVHGPIVNTATPGVVTNAGSGSPNRLVYSLGTDPNPNPTPTPTPSPTPTPTPGCGSPVTGSLSGTGDQDIHPGGTWYQSTTSGTHRGCLVGPSGVDFDLYLQRWNGSSWVTVAAGLTSAPSETVTFNGTPGYYRWRVFSFRGSGTYTFSHSRPS